MSFSHVSFSLVSCIAHNCDDFSPFFSFHLTLSSALPHYLLGKQHCPFILSPCHYLVNDNAHIWSLHCSPNNVIFVVFCFPHSWTHPVGITILLHFKSLLMIFPWQIVHKKPIWEKKERGKLNQKTICEKVMFQTFFLLPKFNYTK
jgi:hypothetical protein